MDTLLQDLRYGFRMLAKKPIFSVIAVLTLALGIGANTAIFSVVNAVLLRSFAFRDAHEIVVIHETTPDGSFSWMSYPNLLDYREQNHTVGEMCACVAQSVNLTGTERPDRVRGAFVSANFFKLLDVQPAHGRAFMPAEDEAGAERVVVVNHNLWSRRFGSDPDFVGKSLILNGEPFTVIGIMPADFQFPMDEIEVWMPIRHYPNFSMSRAAQSNFIIGRLNKGVSIAEASVEMNAIAGRLAEAYPNENKGRQVKITGFQELLVQDIRPALLILLGAVVFILLIACANLANLTLARGASRQKEVAVRMALGASRARLIKQLLTETVLLGLLGGLFGLLVGYWGLDLLIKLSPGPLPGNQTPRLDSRVLIFTLGISILTGVIFGLVPALQLSKPDLNKTLKEGGRGAGEGAGSHRLRGLFVVSQVALSLVLLIGGGLLIKSFYRLLHVDPGFDPQNLLTMEYRLPKNKYPKGEQQAAFHNQVIERIRQIQGVTQAALVRGLPFSGNGGAGAFALADRPAPAKGEEPKALFNAVGPGYFETIGIPVIRGRAFTEQDNANTPAVVLINQTMARKYWPDEDPIGKQIRAIEANRVASVIGIVGDAKQYDLSEKQEPQIYVCYDQDPFIFATLVVRTSVEPMSLAKTVQEAVWSVDSDQPMWKIRTVEYLIERNVATGRFIMTLMTFFAAMAMALTALGIYGVISYGVSQRTHELGIRMALGAKASDVVKLVVRQGMTFTIIGIAAGLVGAFAVTRLMTSLLYEVSATDPSTFAIIPLILAGVALGACFVPARRATKVDPIVALRYE